MVAYLVHNGTKWMVRDIDEPKHLLIRMKSVSEGIRFLNGMTTLRKIPNILKYVTTTKFPSWCEASTKRKYFQFRS